MTSLWLKIKIWTKTTIAAVLVIYALYFISSNAGQAVKFHYLPFKDPVETSALVLIGLTFAAGIVATLIVRTAVTTMRQFRELQARNRIDKLERDQASIKAKAAMLQRMPTSDATSSGPTPVAPVVDSE